MFMISDFLVQWINDLGLTNCGVVSGIIDFI